MAASNARWIRERVEIMRAMKACPSHLKPGECDYAPLMDLMGIYIAHATVSRMVAEGKLDMACGVYLNAALGCHCFCVLHHCTHESISQHNPEHEAVENVAFRLGCMLIFFNDGYKVAHRAHHQRANEPDDPDAILSESRLKVLGAAIHTMSSTPCYASIGIPVSPGAAGFLYSTGLLGFGMRKGVMNFMGILNWDHQLLKMSTFAALDVMSSNDEYAGLLRTLQGTWRGSCAASYLLLALFFARYPHRNGPACGDTNSFHDGTYRGQDQVDLWMMGEGPHHLHHAKSDVSYARLARVSAELEEARPDLKRAFRGNADVRSLEYTHALPPKMGGGAAPPDQFPWERTEAVLRGKDMLLGGDAEGGVAGVAAAVLRSALHVCTTADRALLRQLHKDAGYAALKDEAGHPLPAAGWAESIFSDRTTQQLREAAPLIGEEVARVARGVGARAPRVASEAELKARYLDFFVALGDTMVSAEQQARFVDRAAASLGARLHGDRAALIGRVRGYFESPVPNDFIAKRKEWLPRTVGSEARTRRRMKDMFFGRSAKL